MKRERIKTCILLLLICSSLLLSVSVWVTGGLWPRGYDVFARFRELPLISRFFGQEPTYSIPMDSLSKPQKIVVTNGGSRAVFYNSDAVFASLFTASRAFINTVFANESTVAMQTTVSVEEWYDVLRNDEILDTKSIYIDYHIAFTPKLFAQVSGIESTWLEPHVASLKDMIIAPVDSAENNMLLYVRDFENGDIHKYYVSYENTADIRNLIEGYSENSNYSYAFELNLHDSGTGIGEGVVQKIVMEPLVLIAPQATESVAITGKNPIAPDMDVDALLALFHYRPRSVNRYTGADGTQHFIENYGSLNICADGVIEYYAVDEKMGVGILPQQNDTPTLYESLNGAINFAQRVWESVVPDAPFDVLVTSNLLASETGEYNFTLDYYFEGTPITAEVESSVHEPMHNGVEIQVKNGRITRYRHFIRQFERTGEAAQTIPMLQAIDGIYNQFADVREQTRIADIFLTYVEDNAAEAKRPVWCARVEGDNTPVYYTKTE